MSDINGINPNQINGIEASSLEQTEKVSETAQANTVAQDSIELSQDAENLQRIEQQIKDLPDVDMERVNAIKAQIEQGHYEVKAQSLADKLLALEESFIVVKD